MAEYEKKVRIVLAEHGCEFLRHGKGDHESRYCQQGCAGEFYEVCRENRIGLGKDKTQFNEHYFKETATLAIMFHSVEKLISHQEWYQRTKSYRANIVTYSLAIFHHALKKKFPDAELNLLID